MHTHVHASRHAPEAIEGRGGIQLKAPGHLHVYLMLYGRSSERSKQNELASSYGTLVSICAGVPYQYSTLGFLTAKCDSGLTRPRLSSSSSLALSPKVACCGSFPQALQPYLYSYVLALRSSANDLGVSVTSYLYFVLRTKYGVHFAKIYDNCVIRVLGGEQVPVGFVRELSSSFHFLARYARHTNLFVGITFRKSREVGKVLRTAWGEVLYGVPNEQGNRGAAMLPQAIFYVHGALPSLIPEKSASPARQQAARTHWATPCAAPTTPVKRHPLIPSCIRDSLLIFVGSPSRLHARNLMAYDKV
ncbi:uncharacterized protein TRIVIDRAFT_205556 [Trichoderma virens Gv29-8]|uniref:Uncharacterized protein n=1 Tax=Hypocrea virens (strain Gv29-8 / FGSC 10586) TaxID=413071 RepID=G9N7G4_HYPVG|nr:uncharacterized protein TRIVIDRAFT_205556 [Trichoderma virens Gv29-8]EHK16930.1 hypothetical protein TRIVIDRAFT_205556 [Trichoderma virens Gv29-8]UKZ55343.1 hypothetical protein TrVGV298_009163 [Trichoderma virens]